MTPDVILKEAGVSECVQVRLLMNIYSSSDRDQAAGVNVDDVLGQTLKAKLANSKFGDPENIKAMTEAFEQKVFLRSRDWRKPIDAEPSKTKRMFDGTNATNVIKFGGNRDTDKSVGIFKGQISLKKDEVLAAFAPVLDNIIRSIHRLMSNKRPKVRQQTFRGYY